MHSSNSTAEIVKNIPIKSEDAMKSIHQELRNELPLYNYIKMIWSSAFIGIGLIGYNNKVGIRISKFSILSKYLLHY